MICQAGLGQIVYCPFRWLNSLKRKYVESKSFSHLLQVFRSNSGQIFHIHLQLVLPLHRGGGCYCSTNKPPEMKNLGHLSPPTCAGAPTCAPLVQTIHNSIFARSSCWTMMTIVIMSIDQLWNLSRRKN